MKILIYTLTDPAPVARALERVSGVDVRVAPDAARFEAQIDTADALVLGNSRYQAMERAIVARGRKLRWIQFSSSGYDALKREALRPEIAITRAVGVWAPVVAEHALALSLALLRNLPGFGQDQGARRWMDPSTAAARLRSLFGMNVLVIGYGDVGRTFAARARAFGARITPVASRGRREGEEEILGIERLDERLPQADLVVLTAPGRSDGRPLLDAGHLARLDRRAYLVNVGRGSLVDEAALVARLAAGELAGAALDVTSAEPLPPDAPLWAVPNLILTPHVAGLGDRAALERLGELCARNARNLLDGQPLVGSLAAA